MIFESIDAYDTGANCQLFFNPAIGLTITLSTLAKVAIMFKASRLCRTQSVPLLTTGDAIASFLERTDETTNGMCWASSEHIKKGNWMLFPTIPGDRESSIIYQHILPPKQWRKASGPLLWLVTMFL